jgi:4-hydroxybenzoate polyprenyltransferase
VSADPAIQASAQSVTGSAGATLSAAIEPAGAAGAHASAAPKGHGLRPLIRTLRPHQWVKNLFVMAPMFFHKDVFLRLHGDASVRGSQDTAFLNLTVTSRAAAAMGVFCLLAGAVYTINDLADVEADRVHPIKRNRPIPSGQVSEGAARSMAAALIVVSLGLSYAITPLLAVVALVYFVENLAYSFGLKKVAFLDVGLIAFGFVLRVLAGGIATDVHVSVYMLACTALLALYLGFGKRRHELALENAGKQRAALEAYSIRSLNVALAVTGTATALTYVAWTLDPTTRAFFGSNYLWLTAPFAAFGILRFMLIVSGRAGRGIKAESPTQEMLRDVPLMLDVVLWAVVVLAIVYQLRPNT